MKKSEQQIDLDQARATLRAALLSVPSGGHEYEARQEIFELMKQKRSEGYSFSQIATAFGLCGSNIQPGEVRTMMLDLARESLFSLIQAADELDRNCLTCPLRESIASAQTEATTDSRISDTLHNIRHQELKQESVHFSPPPTAPAHPKFMCLPLQPDIEPLERRAGVPDNVYMEGMLEHPAIPGLWLALPERIYSAYLEYTEIDSVEIINESIHERTFRLKWKKPIPMTRGSTDNAFVDINPALFPRRG